MAKVLISVANNELAYIPVLEIEMEEDELKAMLDHFQEAPEATGEEEPEPDQES